MIICRLNFSTPTTLTTSQVLYHRALYRAVSLRILQPESGQPANVLDPRKSEPGTSGHCAVHTAAVTAATNGVFIFIDCIQYLGL